MRPYDLKILLIDDDFVQHAHLNVLIESIDRPNCELHSEQDSRKALDRVKADSYDLVITDYEMPNMNGLAVFEAIKNYNPAIPVAILTGHESIELAVEILQSGAYDFFVKPVKVDALQRTLIKVEDHNRLEKEIDRLKKRVHKDFSIDSIIGNSPPLRQVIETIGRSAQHNVNVLIRGESGTGKELAAQAIHHGSPRADGPFVIINIAALSESLIESELFGHMKGSFTGADRDRKGLFEEADGGSLFIDEIGDISPAVQVKLLRAIQFKQFQRIGDNQTHKSDVRLIAATSRNLEEMMESGGFRNDLFYRLNVVTITMPPLRDRKSDIPLLIDHIIKKGHAERGLPLCEISREAMNNILEHDYPGNIRELQNVIEHAMVFSQGTFVTTRDLPDSLNKGTQKKEAGFSWGDKYEDTMTRFEKSFLLHTLEEVSWNRSHAARQLGIGERRLRYRMEKLSIDPSATEPPPQP
jgi:DNA-binding NtrC family response regulator